MADWWARGRDPLLQDEAEVGTADLTDSGVTTAKIAAQNVTSECLSANALQRSIAVPLPDLAAGTTAPLTSAFSVWTPKAAVTINAWWLGFQTSMVETTLQTTPVGTLYAGATDVGTVVVPTTDPPARGAQVAGVVAAGAVAAAQAVTFGLTAATSSGMDFPSLWLQIDYQSTD